MKAIFSFWTAPIKNRIFSDTDARLWCLSVLNAKKYFSKVVLYTDSLGADMLINRLKLPFDEINFALENFNPVCGIKVWALGKIYVYSLQTEPFLHIDGDCVFLNKPIEDIQNAEIIVQCPETIRSKAAHGDRVFYMIKEFQLNVKKYPFIWEEGLSLGASPCNLGVFGGSNTSLMQDYALTSLEIANEPENKNFLELNGTESSIMLEQYGLGIFLKKYKKTPLFLTSEANEDRNLFHPMATYKYTEINKNKAKILLYNENKEYYELCKTFPCNKNEYLERRMFMNGLDF